MAESQIDMTPECLVGWRVSRKPGNVTEDRVPAAKKQRRWLRYRCYLSPKAAVKTCVFSLLQKNTDYSQQEHRRVALFHIMFTGVGTYLRGTARAVPLLKVGRLEYA